MTWRDPLIFVLGALVVFLALRPAPEPPADDDAPLRTEQLIEELGSRGWVVVEAKAHRDLVARFGEVKEEASRLEAARADLAQRVRLLDAEVRGTADLLAEARTQLRVGAEAGTESGTDTPPNLSASFDDGTFRGSVRYEPGPEIFDIDVAARIRAGLVVVEGADRRLLFSAFAEDPRVTLSLRDVEYQLPEPIRVCTLGQRIRTGAVSIGGWEAVKLLVVAAMGR